MFSRRIVSIVVLVLVVGGCAGVQRDCSSWWASNAGSDWVVVQYGFDGRPFNCWQLKNVGITNEENSDGIYWVDSTTGHLIHISGWYNRVQVSRSDFSRAATLVGIDLGSCTSGKYISKPQ